MYLGELKTMLTQLALLDFSLVHCTATYLLNVRRMPAHTLARSFNGSSAKRWTEEGRRKGGKARMNEGRKEGRKEGGKEGRGECERGRSIIQLETRNATETCHSLIHSAANSLARSRSLFRSGQDKIILPRSRKTIMRWRTRGEWSAAGLIGLQCVRCLWLSK